MPRSSQAAQRGAFADSPGEFGWTAWRAILARVWIKSGTHNIGFLAAGVAFYGFLALVPTLALLIMMYGLFANPVAISERMMGVVRIFPSESGELISEQLRNLVNTANTTSGLALIPAFAIALYGASGAAGGMISSLNIVYEQEESRGLVRLTSVSIGLVAATTFIGLVGLVAAGALGFVEAVFAGLGPWAAVLIRAITWLTTGAAVSATIAGIYRYAPCRQRAKWRWLSLGSLVATVLWLIGSLLFGWYVSVVGYSATYGSLGAVVALLMWFFVSSYAALLGAFVDAEAERQTSQDSTTGPDRAMGNRGAVVADTSAAMEE